MCAPTRTLTYRSLSGQLICIIGLLIIVPAAFAQPDPVWTHEFENGSSIYSVDFSPNSMLLAASGIALVRLWDVSTQSNVATLEHNIAGDVLGVKFSPNGTMLASITVEYDAAFDFVGSKLFLWDVDSAQLIKAVNHSEEFSAIAFSPDDSLLATGDVTGNVQLWNVASGIVLDTLISDSGSNAVYSLAFSPDGTFLASAAMGFHLWEVNTRSIVTTIEEDYENHHTVAFSPDGTLLVTGAAIALGEEDYEMVVDFWEVGTWNRVGERLLLGDAILVASEFSSDGQYLSSVSLRLGAFMEGVLNLWEVSTQSHKITIEIDSYVLYSMAFSNDDAFLAIGGVVFDQPFHGRIDVWDMQDLLAGGGTDANKEFPSAESLLLGHYPNPVYGHAVVTYTLPFTSHVRLTVFDLLGREVEVLVDQAQSAGNHRVAFAPERLPGGIYFYSLNTGKEQVIRSMVIR